MATRAIGAALAASVFFIPLLISLLTTVPGIVQTSLVEGGQGERAYPIELRGRPFVEVDGTFFVYQTRLRTKDPGRLTVHQQIRLLVLSFTSEPDLRDGELQFAGTPCTYRARSDTRLPDEGLLTFRRGPGCAPLQGVATGEITVKLRFRQAARVALLTYLRPDPIVPPEAVTVSRFGLDPTIAVPIARGILTDVYPDTRASRLALLAYVWDISPSSGWIVAVLAAAALGIWAAGMLGGRGRDDAAGLPGGLRRAAAGFIAALALSGTYAVLVPPFQAADEPNHFLTFAGVLGRPELNEAALEWARRGHFTEIKIGERKFSPLDRGAPGEPWLDVSAPNAVRGAGVDVLWGALRPLLRHARAPQALLALRLVHAFIFAAAVGLFLLVVDRFTDARVPELLAIPLFLVPTLPYFGMHVSNYAPLLSLYVVFAGAVAVACWDGPRSHVAAPVLAAGLMGAIAMSRSAVPLVPIAAAIVFARLVMGDREARRNSAILYWTGLIGVVVAGMVVVGWAHPGGLEKSVARLPIAESRLVTILRHPWWLALPGAALLAIELGLTAVGQRLGPKVRRFRQAPIRTASYVAAALLLATSAASWWIQYPTLGSLDGARPVAFWTYVKDGALASLTAFRFGRPDNLTSITFWGGFGWLETLLPWRVVSMLAGASGVALAALLWWIGRTGSGRALFWVACALAGYAMSLAAYAASARIMFGDLHGRYLLGIYLSGLVIAWSVAARMTQSSRTKGVVLLAVATLACLIVHTYALVFIVSRYF